MSTISGTSGDDTLDGTSGADTVVGGAGADSITTFDGDDSILGNDGLDSSDGGDTIDAGAGADTIQSDGGDDVLSGGAGADSIHGGSDNDWVDGGADGDIVYGDDGLDTVLGGDGDDLIYAGAGDDVVRGGAGTDTLYGHSGADQFIVAAGSGSDVIEDYNAGDGDLIVIDYPGINTYADLTPYLSDDGNFGTLISLPDGSVTQVKWLNYATQSASNFSFQSGTVCLMKGTEVMTVLGPRPVEALRAGMLVDTYDNGLQPLRWVGSTICRFGTGPHRMKPVRLNTDTLGRGRPYRELIVSPQHRIALPQVGPREIFAARALVGWPGVTERPSCRLARFYHLATERHELILANGVWVETLLVSRYVAARMRLPVSLLRRRMTPVRPIRRKPASRSIYTL